MRYIVIDREGNEITSNRSCYIDQNGDLYFENVGVDMPLAYVDEFTYI